jgi:hypothetical protein
MKILTIGCGLTLVGLVAMGTYRVQHSVTELHRELSREMKRLGDDVNRNSERMNALRATGGVHPAAPQVRSETAAAMSPSQVSQLSSEVAAHLAEARAPREVERTREQSVAALKARDILKAALDKKAWTDSDRQSLEELAPVINGHDLFETHRQLAMAINHQEVQVDVAGMPF